MVEAFWDRRVISLYARPSWIVVSVRNRYRTASAALSNDNPIGNSQFEKNHSCNFSSISIFCDGRRFLNCKQLGGGVKLSIPELYVVTTVCKPSM